MILSNCPRCQEPFRVPSGELPEDAYAQCPWCRETFSIGEVLEHLPPVLEVLSADGQPLAPVPQFAASAVGPAGAASGLAASGLAATGLGEAGFASEATPPSVGDVTAGSSTAETVVEESFEFEEAIDIDSDPSAGTKTVTEETVTEETWNEEAAGTAPSDSEPTDFEVQDPYQLRDDQQVSEPISPMKVAPAPVTGKRKKQNSGFRTVVGIVLGGLASLPIAGGLLLAIGKAPDLGFWPFDGGQSAPNVVAAPPAQLSSDNEWRQRPVGQPLGQDDGSELTELIDADPADAALEQITAQAADQRPLEEPGEGNQPQAPLVLPKTNTVADQSSQESRKESISMPDNSTEVVPGEAGTDRSLAASAAMETDSTDRTTDSTAADPPQAAEVAAVDSPTIEPEPTQDSTAAPAADTIAASESEALIDAADRAGKMVGAVSAYKGAEKERTRQLLLTYRQIALTCDLATDDGKSLRALASKIENSAILEDIESFVGSEWLKSTSRKSKGIALVGRPGTEGEGQIMTLASGKTVTITGQKPLPSAERVLALGHIGADGSVEVLLAQPLP